MHSKRSSVFLLLLSLPVRLLLQAQAGQPVVIVLDGFPGAGTLWQAPEAPAGCRLAVADSVPLGAGEAGNVESVV